MRTFLQQQKVFACNFEKIYVCILKKTLLQARIDLFIIVTEKKLIGMQKKNMVELALQSSGIYS